MKKKYVLKAGHKRILFDIDEEEDKKVEFLKRFAKTKARTKVFKYCLNKTYDNLKDVKIKE